MEPRAEEYAAPQAGGIWLQLVTIAQISNEFSVSPHNSYRSFHGIPQNFQQIFTGVNGSLLQMQ